MLFSPPVVWFDQCWATNSTNRCLAHHTQHYMRAGSWAITKQTIWQRTERAARLNRNERFQCVWKTRERRWGWRRASCAAKHGWLGQVNLPAIMTVLWEKKSFGTSAAAGKNGCVRRSAGTRNAKMTAVLSGFLKKPEVESKLVKSTWRRWHLACLPRILLLPTSVWTLRNLTNPSTHRA